MSTAVVQPNISGSKDLSVSEQAPAVLHDPLLCNSELPLREVFYPLGFAVEVTTNSQEVLRGAEESWRWFHKGFTEPAIELRIGVLSGGGQGTPPVPVCRSWRNLVTNISDAENFAVCDIQRGFAFFWLTPGAIENRPWFCYHFLEAITLILLASKYITQIHGACVNVNRRGVLLCGDSGAGKSSLAFACARRGWTYISDDAVSLIRSRKDRVVIGNPHHIRFRESAVQLFPELHCESLIRRFNGELAIDLATERLPHIRIATQSPVDYIVFLERTSFGPPSLVPVSGEQALPWFERTVCYGEKAVRDQMRASFLTLLTARVLKLCYSDLDSAVDLLEGMIRTY